jgi:hypothetical protein
MAKAWHWRRSHDAMMFRGLSFTIGVIDISMGYLGLARDFCAFFKSKTVLGQGNRLRSSTL